MKIDLPSRAWWLSLAIHGTAERDAAMLMAKTIPGGKRVFLAGDKNYDTQALVRELRGMNITPHVAQNDRNRRSAWISGPRGMPGMRLVSGSENGWNNRSGG